LKNENNFRNTFMKFSGELFYSELLINALRRSTCSSAAIIWTIRRKKCSRKSKFNYKIPLILKCIFAFAYISISSEVQVIFPS